MLLLDCILSLKVNSYTFFLKSVHCNRNYFPIYLHHQTQGNMRTIISLILLSSLFSFSTPTYNTETVTQSFSLSQHTTSVIAQLNGNVKIVYWNEDKIQVETSIIGTSSTAEYSMNYMNKKGHFQLMCEYENDINTLLLRPKKINNTIFRRGQEQKTIQSFKIFIPKRVHCMVN